MALLNGAAPSVLTGVAVAAATLWQGSRFAKFLASAYMEEQANYDSTIGPALFHWTPYGGMMGGKPYGPMGALGLSIAFPALYWLVILATYKLRPNAPPSSLRKWMFWHNVIFATFSGWMVIVTLLEIYRSPKVAAVPWFCQSIETQRYEWIQTLWLVSKVYEWLDTIFWLLLHKEPSAEHLYHHTVAGVLFLGLSRFTFLSKMGILFNASCHIGLYSRRAKKFPYWFRRFLSLLDIIEYSAGFLWALNSRRSCNINPDDFPLSETLLHLGIVSMLLLEVRENPIALAIVQKTKYLLANNRSKELASVDRSAHAVGEDNMSTMSKTGN